MNANRETIYSTIFATLQTALDGLNFVTCSRRLRHWSDVPQDQQPALFQQQIDEDLSSQGPAPAPPNKYTIRVDAVIYAHAGSDVNASSTLLLNAAVTIIENLFKPTLKGPVTLGISGVIEIRVHGKIEYGEGNLDGQGIVVIPIRVIAV